MNNMHNRLKTAFDKNALTQLSGFSQFTYDMHGVEFEVNRLLMSITWAVKNDIIKNHDTIAVILFLLKA